MRLADRSNVVRLVSVSKPAIAAMPLWDRYSSCRPVSVATPLIAVRRLLCKVPQKCQVHVQCATVTNQRSKHTSSYLNIQLSKSCKASDAVNLSDLILAKPQLRQIGERIEAFNSLQHSEWAQLRYRPETDASCGIQVLVPVHAVDSDKRSH